eukprot:8346271-Pyramimonas_sp.AAC.1
MVFRRQVLAAATSGLEASVLTKAQQDQIDACVARYARAPLQGTAYINQSADDDDPSGSAKVVRNVSSHE